MLALGQAGLLAGGRDCRVDDLGVAICVHIVGSVAVAAAAGVGRVALLGAGRRGDRLGVAVGVARNIGIKLYFPDCRNGGIRIDGDLVSDGSFRSVNAPCLEHLAGGRGEAACGQRVLRTFLDSRVGHSALAAVCREAHGVLNNMLVADNGKAYGSDLALGSPHFRFDIVLQNDRRVFGGKNSVTYLVLYFGIGAVLVAVYRGNELNCAFIHTVYERRSRCISEAAIQQAVVFAGFFTAGNIIADNRNELVAQAADAIGRGICGQLVLIAGDPNAHSADLSAGDPLFCFAVILYSKRQSGYIRRGIHCVSNSGIGAILVAVYRRNECYFAFIHPITVKSGCSRDDAAIQQAVVFAGFFAAGNVAAENSNELVAQAADVIGRGIIGNGRGCFALDEEAELDHVFVIGYRAPCFRLAVVFYDDGQ